MCVCVRVREREEGRIITLCLIGVSIRERVNEKE